jgi:pyruvate dehydrogenase E2 component (dihydrolipoamide acetyltransferase)
VGNITVTIPDLGGASEAEVIEISVAPGDVVAVEDALLTLEGDKATMDVPSSAAGKIVEILVKVGDNLKPGDAVCIVAVDGSVTADTAAAVKPEESAHEKNASAVKTAVQLVEKSAAVAAFKPATANVEVYAGPAVRRLASMLDLDLNLVTGTGDKGRITKEDVKKYLQGSNTGGSSPLALQSMPQIDFTQFGEIEHSKLSKIQRLSGANLHRNWMQIPHVTQFAEADITELEIFRQQQKDSAAKAGVRLTPIVFIMKAVVASLKQFPKFNSSLSADGSELILKKYFHIGVAVDTPNGLVVPVIRNVEQKSIFALALELAEISEKARTSGLAMRDMQGGCFTISSLGGIGGTAFTPIINAPEVAILGVSKAEQKPIFNNGNWDPRLMLPLALSYDHRVIDGADGARFIMHLSSRLTDIRTLLL